MSIRLSKKKGRTTNVALCIHGSNAFEECACFQTFYRNQIHLNNMHEFAHCFSAHHIHMPHATCEVAQNVQKKTQNV